MKKHKILCFASLITMAFSVTGCDGKKPEEGYLSDEEVLKIVEKFDTDNKNSDNTTKYSRYSIKGNINYFNLPEDLVESTVDRKRNFIFSEEVYNPSSSSYYLAVPLNITLESWTADIHEDPEVVTFNSTKYNLESKIIVTSKEKGYGICKCYYYAREDGGLVVKTFAQNKKLQIKNPTRLDSNSKWNITIEYNKEGYLVSEKFETINAHKDDKSNTVYGEAKYEFI